MHLSHQGFEFKDVSFAYHDKNVLHNLSFTIKPHQMTALVGESGSGKSTIAKLMAGFWDVSEGSILFGGKNIKDIPFAQLMKNISYVAQDNYLFDASIYENIKLGNKDASFEDVIRVSKQTGCHEFIESLDEGYDTIVGNAGGRLSGGERQRITIARAMLKNADTIILDEATAYVDPENELIIQKAIAKLIENKTLIVIAHRLSTVKHADKIIVLSGGKIDMVGRHEELLEKSTIYQKMWNKHLQIRDGGVL